MDDFDKLFEIPITFSGEKGERGERGAKGEKGDVGERGEKGSDGINGIDGINGKDGEKGESGERGEKGERGTDGKNGINGINGKDGLSIDNVLLNEDGELLILKSSGEEINVGKVKGEKGDFYAVSGYDNFLVDSPLVFPEPHDKLHLDVDALIPLITDLTVDNFASPNVSQWTNDAGYITSGGLTGYVPYTGATSNVDLGVYQLKASTIIANRAASAIATMQEFSTAGVADWQIKLASPANFIFYNNTLGSTAYSIDIADNTFRTYAETSLSAGNFDIDAFGNLISAGDITAGNVNGIFSASLLNGFQIQGGTNNKTLTVPLDATVSGTNTGDITKSGENYLTLTGQALTANAIDVSSSNITGTTLKSSVVNSSLTTLGTQSQALNMGGFKITNGADPVSSQDFVTLSYLNNAIAGLLDYRGSYNASTNLFPATGGSGTLGVILKGDFWICSVAGTLGGVAVTPGDLIIAIIDTPGQTAANWDLIPHNLGSYVTSVSGTTNRITSTGGQTPAIDISSTFEALLGKVANPLSQFAATTSAQLRSVLSDETGTGFAYFQGGDAGTPSALVGTNITGTGASFTAGNATKLTTGRTIAITGDLAYTSPTFDGSGNVTAAGTLATVNSNVGTFGSATQGSVITVNGKGLITAASNVTITPAIGSITGLGTGVATALAVNIGSAGAPVLFNGAGGTPSSIVLTNATGTAASLNAGTAATWTTARNLAGNSVNGSANVSFANKFIVQGTTDAGLSAAQFLGALGTGIVKNTTTTGVLSIAAAATDYVAPSAYASANGLTMSTARLLGRTTAATGAAEEITVGSGLTLSAGTLTSTGLGGTVTSVSVVSANGFAGTVATSTTTPAITLTTSVTGVLKGNATAISAATAGVDYSAGTSALTTGILKSTTTTGALTIAVAGDFPTLNQNTTGSAATLTTPRAINGVNFDGSAAITVTAAAGTLTGATLNSTVTISSLTSFGASIALGTPASGVLTNCTGTAASLTAGFATILATTRTINGTGFNGSANIVITTTATDTFAYSTAGGV